MHINWQDKAQNLREIALELNLGVDSLVFVDDNPAERELIRRELPEVDVIELPENPMQYEAALRESVMFERLTLTAEDKQRVRQYQQQRERSVAAQATGSIEDYYRSLQQKVTIRALAADTLGRIAQLTQKTNQFNMTTRRYSEEQIASMAAGGHLVYSVQVEDRFGDNGIVGVVIAQESGQVYEIDTFLLSCRVIGRTVETAILAFLASDALQRGKQEVRGGFQPTKKNLPAERVYALHGFFKVEQPPETPGSLWALPTTPDSIRCPEWIEVQVFKGKESGSYAVQ
jgi:FkbH-like protein